MKVVNEHNCYGFKVLEMDDGKFHLILSDDIVVFDSMEACTITTHAAWVDIEIERLKKNIKIERFAFLGAIVGLIAGMVLL